MNRFNIKTFLLINLGILVMTIGLYYFLIPSQLAVGGVTGLAMVINKVMPEIPIGALMIIFNILLFILAFTIIGKEFGGYTIYCSFALSGLIYLLEIVTPIHQPIVGDLLLNLVYGIMIQGIGMGIIFYQNASTGGTDIVAKIINKFTHLDIGKSLLLADFLITMLAGLTFGLELGLYALLGIIINSAVIDKVIAGLNTKMNLLIISSEYERINNFILQELNRGSTLYYAEGGFSRSHKKIVNTIVTRKEYIAIRKYVKEVDSKAFISVSFVSEVLGEGFNIYL